MQPDHPRVEVGQHGDAADHALRRGCPGRPPATAGSGDRRRGFSQQRRRRSRPARWRPGRTLSSRLPNSIAPLMPISGVVVYDVFGASGQVGQPRPEPVRRTAAPVTTSADVGDQGRQGQRAQQAELHLWHRTRRIDLDFARSERRCPGSPGDRFAGLAEIRNVGVVKNEVMSRSSAGGQSATVARTGAPGTGSRSSCSSVAPPPRPSSAPSSGSARRRSASTSTRCSPTAWSRPARPAPPGRAAGAGRPRRSC